MLPCIALLLWGCTLNKWLACLTCQASTDLAPRAPLSTVLQRCTTASPAGRAARRPAQRLPKVHRASVSATSGGLEPLALPLYNVPAAKSDGLHCTAPAHADLHSNLFKGTRRQIGQSCHDLAAVEESRQQVSACCLSCRSCGCRVSAATQKSLRSCWPWRGRQCRMRQLRHPLPAFRLSTPPVTLLSVI